MPKSLFISYVHEDRAHRNDVETWAKSGLLGPNIVTTAEAGDYRPQGDTAIRNHLNPLIRGAGAVLCLIGDNTHNHAWVQHELSVASSLGKQIILARIPGTRGTPPPQHQHLPVHTLDPSKLRQLL